MVLHAELCSVCQSILSSFRSWPLKGYTGGPHHTSVAELSQAAQHGCPICRWAFRDLTDQCASDPALRVGLHELATGSDRVAIRWSWSFDDGNGCDGWYADEEQLPENATAVGGSLIFAVGIWLGSNFLFDSYMNIDIRAPAIGLEASFEPERNTGSRGTLRLVEHWLEQCCASHNLCQTMRIEEWQPARLLHWTSTDASWSDLALCEAQSGHYGSDVQYMALSHRWTTEQQLLLHKDNKSAFCRKLDYAELKGSIQDGLAIANRLGCAYFWVDSLCIVQDDEEDVAEQISQMDRVYTNSLCNIAASDASNNDEGCFYDRDPTPLQSYRFKLDADGSGEARHHLQLPHHKADMALWDSVLERRAWVFQERLLAPRTVHCCRTQLYWECRELEASEARPTGVPVSMRPTSVFYNDGPSPYPGLSRHQLVWQNLVSHYTTRALTFPEDKLRAFVGVSEVVHRKYGGDYIAGLWRDTLLHDMLWCCNTKDKDCSRLPREHAVAPSWSWASSNSPIVWQGPFREFKIVAKLIQVSYGSFDASRCVESGSAVLHSTQKDITLLIRARIAEFEWFTVDAQGGYSASYGLRKRDTKTDNLSSISNVILLKDDTEALPKIIQCLTIRQSMNEGIPSFDGLMLTPLSNHNQRYLRLGNFITSDPELVDALLEPEEVLIELV
ncbi:hypothetical protein LTR27_007501 [Elasticomyces elasticus]|nr:hypothetical protein LTR27_007501 [Elasticomyces elasticus]